MSVNIKEFHSTAYAYLNQLRENQTSLRYTYRKSNYGGRLEDGYWFYGNDNYFCISFWAGMDWKNRTPNISFFFLVNGEARLEINVSDSDRKKAFVERYLVHPLGLNSDGRRFIKRYGIEEYAGIEFLDLFIKGHLGTHSDKEIIDQILEAHGKEFFGDEDNAIDFIDHNEFRSRDIKIRKYIELQNQEKWEEHDSKNKPTRLAAIRIKNYQDIKEAWLKNIPNTTQWIFITGENGSGKTSVLKAIGSILGYRVLHKKELLDNPFEAEIEYHKGKDIKVYHRVNNEGCYQRFPLVSALVLLGPNRLISYKDKSASPNISKALKKEGTFEPLWQFEYRMLDIEQQFIAWRNDRKKGKDELEKRIYFIRTLLARVVPGLYDIRFDKRERGATQETSGTRYIVRKTETSQEEEKEWQQLPSGTRSVFAMVSEMLIRLYHFQKDIIDPSELRGIVIIDEIDLHLHPIAQRQLIIDLSEVFTNIQFIVATHSPIPLLGAPKGSVFARVVRDEVSGIIIERLTDIEENIGNMLPNILYTSSVFGMHEITSFANENKQDVLTQANQNEAYEFLSLKEKLQSRSINDVEFIQKLKSRLQ